MGTKAVGIGENSDIIIDGVKYDDTTGQWALVMKRSTEIELNHLNLCSG